MLARGDGGIITYSRKGKAIIQLAATEDGEGAIAANNRAGNIKAVWP